MKKENNKELPRAFKPECQRAGLKTDCGKEDKVVPAYERNGNNLGQQKCGKQKGAKVAGTEVGNEEVPEFQGESPHVYLMYHRLKRISSIKKMKKLSKQRTGEVAILPKQS